jgi:hypothetical protein
MEELWCLPFLPGPQSFAPIYPSPPPSLQQNSLQGLGHWGSLTSRLFVSLTGETVNDTQNLDSIPMSRQARVPSDPHELSHYCLKWHGAPFPQQSDGSLCSYSRNGSEMKGRFSQGLHCISFHLRSPVSFFFSVCGK